MNKVIYIFCDIRGTYTSLAQYDRETLLREFSQKLEALGNDNEAMILFSFVSDDLVDYIIPHLQELKGILPANCILGKQFGSDGYLENDSFHPDKKYLKPMTIKNTVNKLKDNMNIVKVLYFDDQRLYVKIVNSKTANEIDIPIEGFDIYGGLANVNEHLDRILESKVEKESHL